SLLDVPVKRLMSRGLASVPPRLGLRTFVDEHVLGGDQRAFPVVDGERLVGLVCLKDARRVPQAEWDTKTVADAMTRAEDLTCVAPDDDGLAAMNALNSREVNQVPVVS